MNKFYIVGRYEECDFEETQAVVACAQSPHQARLLAQTEARDEGKWVWLNTKLTYCHVLQAHTHKTGVVLVDGKNG